MFISHGRSSRKSYIQFLRDNKIPYESIYTNRTCKIISELGKRTFTSQNISRSGMYFISKVRRYIDKNDIALKIPKDDYISKGLKRFVFSDQTKSGSRTNLIEFDLNKAYWQSAYSLGVLSKELYLEGLNDKRFSKVEIVAALGALAKHKRKRYFDGHKYHKSILLDDSSTTKHIWDAISYGVDRCMIDCMESLKKDFYFYWTDAIFFENTKDNLISVTEISKEHGFTGKVVPIKYSVGDAEKVMVYTEKKMGHAQELVRDKNGYYGREFTHDMTVDFGNYAEHIAQIEREYGKSIFDI